MEKIEKEDIEVLLSYAIRDVHDFGDYEELILLLQEGNTAVLQNQEVIQIIVERLRNEKKKKHKSRARMERRLFLGSLAWAYHGAGLVKANNPHTSKTISASRKVGELFHASPSLVKLGMDQVENDTLTSIWFEMGKEYGLKVLDEIIQNGNDLNEELGKFITQRIKK